MISLALIALALLPGPTHGGRVPAPVPPPGAVEPERSALLEEAAALAAGKFDTVAARVKPLLVPEVVRVYVDWVPTPSSLRAGYRAAAAQAVESWSRMLGGTPRFVMVGRDADAELLVLFEEQVARPALDRAAVPLAGSGVPAAKVDALDEDLRFEPAGSGRRCARLRIGLLDTATGKPRSSDVLGRLMSQGLGSYLGVDETALESTATSAPSGPSTEQVLTAARLQLTRLALLEHARKHAAVYVPFASLAVEHMAQDIGAVWQGEAARFAFVLKNAGEAPLEIDAHPRCGCTVATFDHVVRPGASTRLSAEVQTAAFRGRIAKQIDLITNDPAHPTLTLEMAATVRPLLEVEPEQPVIAVREDGPTLQSLEVRVHDPGSASLQPVVSSALWLTATAVPVPAPAGEDRQFKLELTVGSGAPYGRSVARLLLRAASGRTPQAYVPVTVEKGICATPAVLLLTGPEPRTVTLSHRDGTFNLLRANSDDPNIIVQVQTVRDGSEYRLTVSAKGPAHGHVIVQTDDPRQPRIEVPVSVAHFNSAPGAGPQ